MFNGAGVYLHKPFQLSGPVMTRVHPDGSVDRFVECLTARMTIKGYPSDIKITDIDGNVISDTASERRQATLKLAQLSGRYFGKDSTLESLLNSYKSAIDDPRSELVYLYEIRDAFKKKFGSESASRNSLGISKSDWSGLGRLANDPSLIQGRHCGQATSGLRDASSDELSEARSLARSMIEAYLLYLDAQP